jgi:hypothetical protein
MAVATLLFTANGEPNGNDNTMRRQNKYGTASIVGSSPSYVQGGIRGNFASLESIKTGPPNLLPEWCDVKSLSGSGYIYLLNPLGPAITNLALTSNVITITAKNNLAAGDVVKLSGLTVNTALNGISLTVLAGSLSATSFTANFTNGNISSAAETGYCLPTSYASGAPFQGNVQIFESAGSAASLTELSTASLPAGITGSAGVNGDQIGFRAEFVRAN